MLRPFWKRGSTQSADSRGQKWNYAVELEPFNGDVVIEDEDAVLEAHVDEDTLEARFAVRTAQSLVASGRRGGEHRRVQVVEIFVLAAASMVWPALIAVVVVALASPKPVKLLAFFLAGALLTTVTIGLIIVFVLRGSSLFSGSRSKPGAVVDLVAGGAALLLAYVALRRGRTAGASPAPPSGPSWWERMLSHGALLAFLVGIVLNVFPGLFPLVALKDIAQLGYSATATVALVVGFYLVMFLPAEVPLGSYLVEPVETARVVGGFNTWLGRNARNLAVAVLVVIGVYLVVRGIISLAGA